MLMAFTSAAIDYNYCLELDKAYKIPLRKTFEMMTNCWQNTATFTARSSGKNRRNIYVTTTAAPRAAWHKEVFMKVH